MVPFNLFGVACMPNDCCFRLTTQMLSQNAAVERDTLLLRTLIRIVERRDSVLRESLDNILISHAK